MPAVTHRMLARGENSLLGSELKLQGCSASANLRTMQRQKQQQAAMAARSAAHRQLWQSLWQPILPVVSLLSLRRNTQDAAKFVHGSADYCWQAGGGAACTKPAL